LSQCCYTTNIIWSRENSISTNDKCNSTQLMRYQHLLTHRILFRGI
jgi:hypothetical protein